MEGYLVAGVCSTRDKLYERGELDEPSTTLKEGSSWKLEEDLFPTQT